MPFVKNLLHVHVLYILYVSRFIKMTESSIPFYKHITPPDFVKEHSSTLSDTDWRWHHQNIGVSSRQHFRGLCGKGFSIDSRNPNSTNSSYHLSVLIRNELYSLCSSLETNSWKSNLHFTCRYNDDVLSIN